MSAYFDKKKINFFQFRKEIIFDLSFSKVFAAIRHSQIVNTRQPFLRNFLAFSLSLFALRCNLAIQYLRLLEGTRHFGHLCKCQKQPLTLMIFINRGKTMSGQPGRERTCRR